MLFHFGDKDCSPLSGVRNVHMCGQRMSLVRPEEVDTCPRTDDPNWAAGEVGVAQPSWTEIEW